MKVRRKKCKECLELFTPVYSTTQETCSIKCAISLSKKRTKDKKTKIDKAFSDRKNKNKLQTLLDNVKNTCHQWIRLRDEGLECISCQKPYIKSFQAGHFYKSELFSSIRFNEFNINGQCRTCNLRKEGNESEYRVNLPHRIGIENFEELDYLASLDKKKNFKWDREDLIRIRKHYQYKIKNFKK